MNGFTQWLVRCGINSHVTSDLRRALRMIVSHGAPQKRNFMLRNVTTIAGCFGEVWTSQRNVYYVRLLHRKQQPPMNISAAQPQWINLRKITSDSTFRSFYKSFTSERLFIYYLPRGGSPFGGKTVERVRRSPPLGVMFGRKLVYWQVAERNVVLLFPVITNSEDEANDVQTGDGI
ncbi:MAG: hypothetical protein ACTS5A_03295 [Candidatus Hodgkinia cicadicola]